MERKMSKLYYGDNLDILRKYIKEDKAQSIAFMDTWKWDNLAECGFNEIIINKGHLYPTQVIDLIIGLQKILGRGNSLFAYIVHMAVASRGNSPCIEADRQFFSALRSYGKSLLKTCS